MGTDCFGVPLLSQARHHCSALYSGVAKDSSHEWLVKFQDSSLAWKLCEGALRKGPASDSEDISWQAFCALTLAAVARALPARCSVEERLPFRQAVQALLTLHSPPCGQPSVWKQIALALTCTDLWLGRWSPAALLSAPAVDGAVIQELLSLPTELLFSERSLPLNDEELWQSAIESVLEACPSVFAHVFSKAGAQIGCARDLLHLLTKWLRASRMSFEWGPPCHEAQPLKQLSVYKEQLVVLATSAPDEACGVVQQLARWRKCDKELVPLLQPLLACLFSSHFQHSRHSALLPLFTDLASDRWPRAALGEGGLDWQAMAQQAIALLHSSVSQDAGEDGEAALAVWQTFAVTVQDGTREWFDDQVIRPSGGGPHSEWYITYECFSQADCLPQLFGLLCDELIALLRMPPNATIGALRSLWVMRGVAEGVITAWSGLIGRTSAWEKVTWQPLQVAMQRLSRSETTTSFPEDVLQDLEVLLWLSATLASKWPAEVGPAPTVQTVRELDSIDAAPESWRGLLWSAACTLATHVPMNECPNAIEWMLQRSAYAAGSSALLELTELSYAQALEVACRRLPRGPGHVKAAERILAVALTEVPASGLHGNSGKARGLLLQAVGHVMGDDTGLLCQGLRRQVLPLLHEAVEAEAAAANSQWHAAQTLFATLSATLPRKGTTPINDAGHPVVLLFRDQWPLFEAALLSWTPSPVNDEPLCSAATLLALSIPVLPVLLPQVVHIFAQSLAQSSQPELQLTALCDVASQVPCPPFDAAYAAGLLGDAIFGIAKALILRRELLQNERALSKFFKLLGTSIAKAPPVCGGLLRPRLLSLPTLTRECLCLLIEALPHITVPDAIENMLRFATRLVHKDEARELQAHREAFSSMLPQLCVATCSALATQTHYSTWSGLINVGDLFCLAYDAFPDEIGAALALGLQSTKGLSEWSRTRMSEHIQHHAKWPCRSAWLGGFQQIIQQWQSERRQGLLTGLA